MSESRVARCGAAALALALSLGLTGCAPQPLPEAGSPAAQLYAARCGGCHRPYNPQSMTAAMWAIQVDAMQLKIAQAGQAPLSADERRAIVAYLVRNAGHQ